MGTRYNRWKVPPKMKWFVLAVIVFAFVPFLTAAWLVSALQV